MDYLNFDLEILSRTLDYIFAKQPTKVIKDSSDVTAAREEPPKPLRKPKEQEQLPEQMRMFLALHDCRNSSPPLSVPSYMEYDMVGHCSFDMLP